MNQDKIEKAIETLVELLKEIKNTERNDEFIHNIPALLEGIGKSLHRIKNGEENVWESVGEFIVQTMISDNFPPGSGLRIRISITKA